jgi:hypothetical protein
MLCIKLKQYRSQKKESGQAIMEFVLSLMIVISFFFFYVKMAAVFAVANYIHYATFMAARAYVSSAGTEELQRGNAEIVLTKMIGSRFKAIVTATDCDAGCPQNAMAGVKGGNVGQGPYAQESSYSNRWNQGVTYSYKAKLSLFPWNRESEALNMKLVSESWMPREPSEEECKEARAKIQTTLASGGRSVQMEWDNGY